MLNRICAMHVTLTLSRNYNFVQAIADTRSTPCTHGITMHTIDSHLGQIDETDQTDHDLDLGQIDESDHDLDLGQLR